MHGLVRNWTRLFSRRVEMRSVWSNFATPLNEEHGGFATAAGGPTEDAEHSQVVQSAVCRHASDTGGEGDVSFSGENAYRAVALRQVEDGVENGEPGRPGSGREDRAGTGAGGLAAFVDVGRVEGARRRSLAGLAPAPFELGDCSGAAASALAALAVAGGPAVAEFPIPG